ncbi:MAG TPA: serine/threonine-protein kinase [Longimicrobium sp.]|jgi:serine/threonine-protein kinase
MSGLEGLLAGRTLAGRYRIEEVIGRGGFAAVYRASDERLGRTVAVKVITVVAADLATRDQVRRRFEREARVAASLDHPNVVTVYDVGTDPDLELDFLVMELLRGDDLARRLARPAPFALPMAARILRDAARGIAAGHLGGLIHRDVKPANIFLAEHDREERFRVCILDFGIAQIRSAEHSLTKLTRGAAPLSPRYASPEQLQEEVELTPASDVFSLGVIGYELLTGERPFGRDQIRSMTRGEPPSPPSFDALPGEVRDIIRRAMEWDPAERYPEAGELADALDAALRTLRTDAAPVVAVPPRPAERETAAAAAAPLVLPASAPVVSAPEPAPPADSTPAPAPPPVAEREPEPVQSEAPAPEPVTVRPVAPVPRPEPALATPAANAPAAHAPAQQRRTGAGPSPRRARRASPLLLLGLPLLLALGAIAWWAMARERPAEPRRAQAEAPRPAATPPPAAAPTPRTPDSLGWSSSDTTGVLPGAPQGAAPGGVPGTGAPIAGATPAGSAAPAPAAGAPRAGPPTGTPAGTQRPRAPAPAVAAAGGTAAARYAREAEGHFERGNLPAAVAGFRRAVAAAPGNALYRNQLGWALFQSGDMAGAERELQETLRLDPNRAIAHANLGEVRRVQGDTDRAIGNYRRFLELNTDPRRERIAREKLRGMGATP